MANRKLPGAIYHLSGVVYCAECGNAMSCTHTYTARNGRRWDYITIRCVRHERTRHCSYSLAMRQLRRAIEAVNTLDIDALLQDDAGLSELLQNQIAEQQAAIERTQAAMQRADDAFVAGTMDGDRYRRQVDRLTSQMTAAQKEIERLRTRYSDEADTAKRRRRIEDVAAVGLANLDGEPSAGNVWLRRHVRLWAQDGRIVSVEWL